MEDGQVIEVPQSEEMVTEDEKKNVLDEGDFLEYKVQ